MFVDPPFDSGLAAVAWRLLCEAGLVRPGGFVYLEAPRYDNMADATNSFGDDRAGDHGAERESSTLTSARVLSPR